MKIPRRYSIALLGCALSLAAGLFALAFYLDPLWGDLTRLGWVPEHLYGNNIPETVARQKHYDKDRYDRHYHVVVIGDSFSHSGIDKVADLRVWQNPFHLLTGLSITTFHVELKDWRDLIDAPVFREAPPELFIYEVVERNLKARLGKPRDKAACGSGEKNRRVGGSFPIAPVPAEQWDLTPLERPRSELTSAQVAFARDFVGNRVRQALGLYRSPVRTLPLSRPLFSSRRPDELLVIQDDFGKAQWTEEDLRTISCNLRQIQAEVEKNGHTRFLAVIVPDKLTTYAEFVAQPGFVNPSVLERIDLAGIRLLRVDRSLREAVRHGELDVYSPDNTHLSGNGYRVVADTLVRHLRETRMVHTVASMPPAPVIPVALQAPPHLACRIDQAGHVEVVFSGPDLRHAPRVNYYVAAADGEKKRFFVAEAGGGIRRIDWSSGPMPAYRRETLEAHKRLKLPAGTTGAIFAGWGRDDEDLLRHQRYARCTTDEKTSR